MTEGRESVTERNKRRLRDAADRLLGGRAEASDGKLTLKSLSVESGVPRPYLYRAEYRAIAEDFKFRAQRASEQGVSADARLAEIVELRKRLADQRRLSRSRLTELGNTEAALRKAADQIIFLFEQNRALREELHAARKVIPAGWLSE